jgi:ABC-type nitrate/sulfonate/bicarbonate transport system permease component
MRSLQRRVSVGGIGASGTARRTKSMAPFRGLLPLAFGFGLWQAIGSPDSPYFPVPFEWFHALQKLAVAGRLWPAVFTTLTDFATALILNVSIGSTLGVLLGRSKLADRLLGPSLEFGRTMPAGALVPVAVLIMGYTSSMTLVVVVLTSFWPILLNARTGARGISEDRLDTARVLRLSWWATQWKIILPSVIPSIQLGTQISAPITLIIVLLVEILTQVSGVGREIALAQSVFRSATVYGLVVITGLLGLTVSWIISWIGSLTRKYDPLFSGGFGL